MILRILQFAVCLVLPAAAWSQEILKHPRVVQLEDNLKDAASSYVRGRFPGVPFMVTVRIDPLRRETGRSYSAEKTSLPFFDSEEDEEIKDEWDNPQIPLAALINRVRRIQMTILMPSKVRETEITELKEGLFSALHLTPARDEIQFDRKDWAVQEIPWIGIYLGVATLMLLLLGLLLINRTSANRIARALTDLKTQNTNQAAGPPSAPMSFGDSDLKSPSGSSSQELKFNDPLKMKDLASRNIEILIKDPAFPNHRDIFIMDKFGHEHPEKLGAILGEFSGEMQKRLFSYAADFHWIEALNEPAFLDFDCLEVFQALTQNTRRVDEIEWSQTVLSVWRLNENRTAFLKELPKDEAFALLAEMPKAIAVSEARKAFPGSWASILDPDFKAKPIAKARANEIRAKAVATNPLYEIELVSRYRADRELLEYLKIADFNEERDIYGAAPASSLIHTLRAPFFVVLDQDSEMIRWFVPLISVDQWAFALFNMPKSERSKIDQHLTEKQRYILIERFKKMDAQPPDRYRVGEVRELIALAFKKYLADKNTADQFNSTASSITEISNDRKAA